MARDKNIVEQYFLCDNRKLSIVVLSLFSSWMLAFPFQGKILHAVADYRHTAVDELIFWSISCNLLGLLLSGFFVRSIKYAKNCLISSTIICLLASGVFFFPPSGLWTLALALSSFLSGCFVAAWGFFFKSGTPRNQRITTAADGLIYSNILMILLNMAAIHLSAYTGLALSMLMLGAALFFAFRLPADTAACSPDVVERQEQSTSIVKQLAFLCLFIVVITINSGLMYQVLNPAFVHLASLTSWYWAVPYVVALFIMRNLSRNTNRNYILYIAMAMIGFSFIAFMVLDRSAADYLLVNSLMLGACGVYDLFWWSILGEMLDFSKNPTKIFGIGLSANVLGVLLGGLIGKAITSADMPSANATLLALGVICVTLVILPPLHRHLTLLLKDHPYLTVLAEMPAEEQRETLDSFIALEQLTEREGEIAMLLLKGKTYKTIAEELYVSENTVKTHVKSIYSKYKVQRRIELVHLMRERSLRQ